jgi:hypothetical protein
MNDDNVKWIDISEKMVKQMLEGKQKEYGDFGNNSYIIANFIQSVLEVVNGYKVKVPITLIPQLMIVLKLTRTIDDGTKKIVFKEDTHKDIAGYNNLLRQMMINTLESENKSEQN